MLEKTRVVVSDSFSNPLELRIDGPPRMSHGKMGQLRDQFDQSCFAVEQSWQNLDAAESSGLGRRSMAKTLEILPTADGFIQLLI